MTAHSIGDVVESKVVFAGMRQVPVEERTKFLSNHGSGYLARVLEEFLRMLDIRHIYCAHFQSGTISVVLKKAGD